MLKRIISVVIISSLLCYCAVFPALGKERKTAFSEVSAAEQRVLAATSSVAVKYIDYVNGKAVERTLDAEYTLISEYGKDQRPDPVGTHSAGETALTSDSEEIPREWTTGWYVVEGRIPECGQITVSGDVRLILKDGCDFKIDATWYQAGIFISEGSLTIYAQSVGRRTGKLTVNAGAAGAGIGGNSAEDGQDITINGGVITARGSRGGAGIGGGGSCSPGAMPNPNELPAAGEDGVNGGDGLNITVNGGSVTAIGEDGGAGIGGGAGEDGGYGTIQGLGGAGGRASHITVNGGTLTAMSISDFYNQKGGSCIGGGSGGTGSADGEPGESSDIRIASSCEVYAGSSEGHLTKIYPGSDGDYAEKLTGKAYVTVRKTEDRSSAGDDGSSAAIEKKAVIKAAVTPVSIREDGCLMFGNAVISRPAAMLSDQEKTALIANGSWMQDGYGFWYLKDVSGTVIKNRWVLVSDGLSKTSVGNASWYYLGEDGKMSVGWQWLAGPDGSRRCYYLNEEDGPLHGACVMSGVTPDGFQVDETGAWIEDGTVKTR